MATITSVQGRVDLRETEYAAWQPAALEGRLCAGTEVRTGPLSRAQVRLQHDGSDAAATDGTLLQLNERSSLVLPAEPEAWWVRLVRGAVHVLTRTPRNLTVKTLFMNAKVEGTEFLVQAGDRAAEVSVFEGTVNVGNDRDSLILHTGESATAAAGQAPRREIRLHPRDAVQWALYYPPIVDTRTLAVGHQAQPVREAIALYAQGDVSAAIMQLDQINPTDRTLVEQVLRAALFLSVGQVEPARVALHEVTAAAPHNAHALALTALIALVQNDKAQARRRVNEAVTAAPDDATALIALSYVQQSEFDLAAAAASARKAADHTPENALAWARLAELELAQGHSQPAKQAIAQARRITPNLARTHTLAGYAALSGYDFRAAGTAFQQAIARDPADPLPRLGLGLSEIRQGDLRQGRRTIEIAANLDPNNALLRSYLGKAYYEERRSRLAGVELDNAKALDPQDPTPWFYDAIRKQTENRPIEAVQDLQQSEALNDNRAVYRSKFALDQDHAARGAALGRIYRELRFEQSALPQAWAADSADPGDPGPHRMLSDTYAVLPRREIARVSELLQSQLLQPINISPVQPQLSETNLFLLGGLGPAQTSLNEFNPLFMRDQVRLLASGLVGSHGLGGDEAVLTGIHDRFSYSLGQTHYGFSGFRQNNDFDTNLYNGYLQYALGERGNVQLELRHQDANQGDLREFNDFEFPVNNLRQTSTRSSVRVGAHFNFEPGSDLLASFVYSGVSRDGTLSTSRPLDLGLGAAPPEVLARTPNSISDKSSAGDRLDTLTFELQQLRQWHVASLVSGMSYSRRQRVKTSTNATGLTPPLTAFLLDDLQTYGGYSPNLAAAFVEELSQLGTVTGQRETSIESMFNAYSYLNFHLSKRVQLLGGLSFQLRDRDSDLNSVLSNDDTRVNPKLGLTWMPMDAVRLRAGWFRRMTGPLATAQTIEPTQIAGFNQLFNDEPGTQFEMYGFGADLFLKHGITSGFEVTWRNARVPVLLFGEAPGTLYVRQREQQHRLYLQWLVTERIAAGVEYFFEEFDRVPKDILSSLGTSPYVATHRLPVSVAYFHPNGIFARIATSFVAQDAQSILFNDPAIASTDFWVSDLLLGFRLPKRRGLVSFGINNIFDAKFAYRDANPNLLGSVQDVQDLRPPRFAPERSFYGQVSLAF